MHLIDTFCQSFLFFIGEINQYYLRWFEDCGQSFVAAAVIAVVAFYILGKISLSIIEAQ